MVAAAEPDVQSVSMSMSKAHACGWHRIPCSKNGQSSNATALITSGCGYTLGRSEGAAATVPGGLIVAGYVDTPVEFYDEEKVRCFLPDQRDEMWVLLARPKRWTVGGLDRVYHLFGPHTCHECRREGSGRCGAFDSNSGHQLLRPPANCFPMFESWNTRDLRNLFESHRPGCFV